MLYIFELAGFESHTCYVSDNYGLFPSDLIVIKF